MPAQPTTIHVRVTPCVTCGEPTTRGKWCSPGCFDEPIEDHQPDWYDQDEALADRDDAIEAVG